MSLTADWTDEDLAQLDVICVELGGRGLDLLSTMYAESGAHSWALNDNPKTRQPEDRWNAAGLNQCMPFILSGLGFHPELGPRARAEAFCKLTVGQQLPYVRRYYLPHKGKLVNVSAWYLATFLPAFLSHADEPEYVLATKGAAGFSGAVYYANAAFDADRDLKIQVRELGEAVTRNCVGQRWHELEARLMGKSVPPPEIIIPPARSTDLGTWLGIQMALKSLGYDPGPIDGFHGPKTRAGVLAFQKDHPPLAQDGVYGPATRAALALAAKSNGV